MRIIRPMLARMAALTVAGLIFSAAMGRLPVTRESAHAPEEVRIGRDVSDTLVSSVEYVKPDEIKPQPAPQHRSVDADIWLAGDCYLWVHLPRGRRLHVVLQQSVCEDMGLAQNSEKGQ